MAQMKLLTVVAVVAFLGYASAQSYIGLNKPYLSLQSCPDIKSRFEQVSYSLSEISEVIESKVRSYDSVFTHLPKSKGVICAVKAALQELKSVLEYCRTQASGDKLYLIEKWVRKLDALINFGNSLCYVVSNPGPELHGVSEGITTFLQKIKQVKSSIKEVEFSDCDSASSLIDTYEQQLDEIKSKYHRHTSSLSNLFAGTRGRFLDSSKVGGDFLGFNNVSLSIIDSYLENSNLNYGNKKATTVNNYGPRRPRPQPGPGPQPGPYDQQEPDY